MLIIEINKLSNGAHNNQSWNNITYVPEGFALIPGGMETPNFPFGDITHEVINGVDTVTSWTPLPMPEPEPEPIADLTLEERINDLEIALCEIVDSLAE